MAVHFHEEDLPAGVLAPGPVAVDTETMGLVTPRDRLCVVQISDGQGDEHLVRFGVGSRYDAPKLKAVLADPQRIKLYHFARFDLAAIEHYLGVTAAPVFCTKIASKLTRTYTDRHGLKNLVSELLGEEISKQQQSSDWGAPELSEAQRDYAASDVRYLHRLAAVFQSCVKMSWSAHPAMSRRARVGRKSKQAWAIPRRPSRTSRSSNTATSRWR